MFIDNRELNSSKRDIEIEKATSKFKINTKFKKINIEITEITL